MDDSEQAVRQRGPAIQPGGSCAPSQCCAAELLTPMDWAIELARGLAVRHDHGSQYLSDAFHNELRFLGIDSSPAFVRASEGNACAERFIRTLKTFDTIEQLRQALLAFRDAYNATWLIARHGFRAPGDFRQNQLQPAARAA